MLAIESPFPQFFDLEGNPLNSGSLYFGVANQNPETNPITVYWDAAGTQPASQPIPTINGYAVRNGTPALLFANVDYSITVRDMRGAMVFTAANSDEFSNSTLVLSELANSSDATKGSALVGFLQSGTGAVGRTVQSKLRDIFSVKDFGAAGDGVADDTAEIQAAVDAVGVAGGGTVYLPRGSYKISSPITNSAYNFVNIVGAGRNATRVFGSSGALASLFKIGGGSSGPFRCSVKSMSLDTAQIGVDINSGATNTDLDDLVISTSVYGVKNVGDYTTNPIKGNQGSRLNRLEISGYSTAGIYNYCASELYWDEIVCNGGGTGTNGIFLDTASNAVYAGRANLLSNTYGLRIDDVTGISPNPTSVITTPSQMWFSKVLGDTGVTAGIYAANCFEVNFFDCWGSGSTNGDGIVIASGAKEIALVSCRALGNSKHGLVLSSANANSRVKVTGGQFASNGYATSNTYDGINVAAGFGNFTIEGATCYNDTGLGLGSTQRYGIRLESGATDNFVLSGCVNNNNLSGGVSDLSTGVNKQIFGNIPKEDNNALFVGNSGFALRGLFFGSVAFDPGSTPDGSIQVVGVSVPGAPLGAPCFASFDSITASGWLVTAEITSTGNAAVTLLNKTGGAVDLAAGTVKVIALNVS